MNDDTAVREMLHDLTLGQPDAPVDRMSGVRRRHVRRRSLQGATTVVTAAAAIVGVLLAVGVLTGSSTENSKPLQQPAKSWQLPWPDRSDEPGSALERQALRQLHDMVPPPVRDVHWLFAGEAVGTWAVLEATTGSGSGVHQLIAMTSRDNGQTWALSSGPAPNPSTRQIGFALPGDRTVLILAAPGVDQVALRDLSASGSQALSFVDTSGSGIVSDQLERAPKRDELLVGTPDLVSTFVVGFPNQGTYRMPQWQRDLVSHAPRMPGYRAISSESGDVASSSTNGTTVTERHHRYSGPMLEIIRCAGQAPLSFTMTAGGETSTQQIPRCDGQDQVLHLGKLGHDQQFRYTISGDPIAVYAIAVYVQKAK